MENHAFNVYKDIQSRTNGALYLGVVGPVRTGKAFHGRSCPAKRNRTPYQAADYG